MKEIKESTYKGCRILLGNEKRDLLNNMINILIEEGFEEIQIPNIQYRELFKGKVGIENTSMMFSVKDNSDRDLVLAPEYCQVKNTLISTTDGIFELGELGNVKGENTQNINVNVYTDKKNNIETATKFFCQGKRKTKKIKLNSGIEIECTENHKYRVLEDNKYVWKYTRDLKIGDKLPYSVGEYNGGNYQNLKHNYKKSIHNTSKQIIKLPNILNEEFAWFLGLYYADGCNLNRGFHIYGNKKIKRGFNKLKNILNKLNISYKYYEQKNDNRCYISINCVELISFLKENKLLKDKSFNIKFPLLIRKSTKSVISSFIDGYLCGDGHVYPQGDGCSSVSKKFINELTIIRRAIGVDGKYIRESYNKNRFGKRPKYKYHSRKGRLTNINNRNKDFKILDILGYDNLLYDEILSIKNSENFVYEISVPKGNTYIANTYISHNTAVVQQLAKTYFKLQKDVKLFYIQECFRGEKPQAGRFRQFTQLGVEILNPSKDKDYYGYLTYLSRKLLTDNFTNKFSEEYHNYPYKLHNNVMRGLDYYKNGKGFEITIKFKPEDGEERDLQLIGGGEYDGGIGFAIGIDRLLII